MSTNGNLSDANSDIAAAAAAAHARGGRLMSEKPTTVWDAISLALTVSQQALLEVRALAKASPQGEGEKLAELKSRLRRLEERIRTIEEQKLLRDGGTWNRSSDYDTGDVVTHDGSCWVAQTWHRGEVPGKSNAWRLLVKRGRDGKDAAGSR